MSIHHRVRRIGRKWLPVDRWMARYEAKFGHPPMMYTNDLDASRRRVDETAKRPRSDG